jgi:hypothetical protein
MQIKKLLANKMSQHVTASHTSYLLQHSQHYTLGDTGT